MGSICSFRSIGSGAARRHKLPRCVFPFPFPRRLDYEFQVVVLRLPASLGLEFRDVGNRFRRVTGAPPRFLNGEIDARHLLGGLDDLFHGEAPAVAAVHDIALICLDNVFQCPDMCLREIIHMDVVADAGAVEGRVVVAEDHELLELSCGCFQRPGDEVGRGLVGLANPALWVGPCYVEVSQSDIAEVRCVTQIFKNSRNHDLCSPIGTDGIEKIRFLCRDCFGLAVNSGRGGVDEETDAASPKHIQKDKGIGNVIPVIFNGFPHRLLHLDVSGEMDDGIGGELPNGFFQKIGVSQIPFHELSTKNSPFMTGGKVVVD